MIKIVADTTSCIPPADAEKLGIGYLPQIIIFGNDSYRDDTELTPERFLTLLKASSTLPKTAAPAPALYAPIYEEFSKNGNTILVLCPSKEVSGTFRSATVAAQDFPEADIRVIDTLTIGPALGTMVRSALEWAEQGVDADTIVERVIEKRKSVRIYFYVETLEHLYKGGRIGGASALMGSLLQVKPILQFKDGKIQPFENQRTRKRALNRLVEIVKSECPKSEASNLTILESDALQTATELSEDFKAHFGFASVDIFNLPPAIVVHVGPGVIAASFFLN